MLHTKFAKEFVGAVQRQLAQEVYIFNEMGVLVASSALEQEGSFDPIAYAMLQAHQYIQEVEHLPGSDKTPGVYLLLQDNGEAIGVLGIGGQGKQTLLVAKTLKFAFEFEGTIGRKNLYANPPLSINITSKLVRPLLFDRPQSPAQIIKLLKQANLKPDCPRLPILIHFFGEHLLECSRRVLDTHPMLSMAHAQDMLLPIDGQSILLCKALEERYANNTRQLVEDYMADLEPRMVRQCHAKTVCTKIRYLVAPVQYSVLHYQNVYEKLLWLLSYKRAPGKKAEYLTDYLLEYAVSQQEESALNAFFEDGRMRLKHMDMSVVLCTLGALVDANMKPVQAAQALHMHKNTVIARLRKINEALEISPLSNTKDAVYLIGLFRYLSVHP